MPLYDYECCECGHVNEEFLHLHHFDRDIRCGECGGTMKRLISAPARIIDDNPEWLAHPDPRHPDSPNRNLVNPFDPVEMKNLPKTRSERQAMMDRKGLVCVGDATAGSDTGTGYNRDIAMKGVAD